MNLHSPPRLKIERQPVNLSQSNSIFIRVSEAAVLMRSFRVIQMKAVWNGTCRVGSETLSEETLSEKPGLINLFDREHKDTQKLCKLATISVARPRKRGFGQLMLKYMSAQPLDLSLVERLPLLQQSSAYRIIITPGDFYGHEVF